jgi:XapX domain-containing protein
MEGLLMKVYLISLAVGVLVGIIYALLHVRSPAPPAVALVGLLGMLLGEQAVPITKRLLAGEPVTSAWLAAECVPKITGHPPANAHVPPFPAPASSERDIPKGPSV